MKTVNVGDLKVIMSNPDSKFNYFAWPTVARLQNGRIAVVASGFRQRHVCPYGKLAIAYSEDEGETYSSPAVITDTPLDDRDAGIMTFGESGVWVGSAAHEISTTLDDYRTNDADRAYLATITPEEEAKYTGSLFRLSFDYGVTFGPIMKAPVYSPHGPLEMPDGTLLWVGRVNDDNTDGIAEKRQVIQAYRVTLDGECEYLGTIPDSFDEEYDAPCHQWEPHAIRLDDGTLIAHIRTQNTKGPTMFTIYQSESHDDGHTWTDPHPIMRRFGGAPAHLMMHSSGKLISTYSCRDLPYGVKVMISLDGGKSWDVDHIIYACNHDADLGYPSTVELSDGSLLTVFYAKNENGGPCVIKQQKWRIED